MPRGKTCRYKQRIQQKERRKLKRQERAFQRDFRNFIDEECYTNRTFVDTDSRSDGEDRDWDAPTYRFFVWEKPKASETGEEPEAVEAYEAGSSSPLIDHPGEIIGEERNRHERIEQRERTEFVERWNHELRRVEEERDQTLYLSFNPEPQYIYHFIPNLQKANDQATNPADTVPPPTHTVSPTDLIAFSPPQPAALPIVDIILLSPASFPREWPADTRGQRVDSGVLQAAQLSLGAHPIAPPNTQQARGVAIQCWPRLLIPLCRRSARISNPTYLRYLRSGSRLLLSL